MTTHRGLLQSVVGSTGFLIGLILLIWPTGILEAGTVVSLAWDANLESDLAGYRIHFGTASRSYTLPVIDVGPVNGYSVPNLAANTTYYFVVTAYDRAGNESLPSNEVAVQPTVTTLTPTISQAVELGTGSVYILQSGSQTIQVNGSNFQSGATVGLGADISVGPTSLMDSGHLTASITVSSSALLGPRTLSVTNPDSGMASRPNTLTVVKTADINRDCKIDLFDLNLLARAWNTLSSDPAYIASADLDGDGDVGGADLDILVSYLGQRLAVCP
ncbi:MAG: hypothetical protein DMF52_05125 [Acidobacteria bacterium]|nr:MAG: hypothetical protein DMF52_05125 [Acidobacteriota bacterium]